MNRHRTQAFLLLTLLSGTTLAAEPAAPWSLSLYLENDLFAGSDRAYTNGIGFNWISPDLRHFSEDERLPKWLRRLNQALDRLHPDGRQLERNVVLTLAQKMYTPADPQPSTLLPDQRPYAGWLYLGIGFHGRHGNRLDSAELNLGVVGPAALAEEAQNLVHDLRDILRFNGWDNQLENEPGVQLVLERKYKWMTERAGHQGWSGDLIGHGGISLGNVATHLNAGLELRGGYNLPDDFGTSSLRPGANNASPGRHSHEDGFGGHLFLSLEGRAIARDITLDGNTFRDSHRVHKEPLLAEGSVGGTITWRQWKLSYARVFRSREYAEQDKSHSYGSVALSYTGTF